MIEMETKPSCGVRVTIRIPIRGNGQVKCVSYSRTYYDNERHDCMPNREHNDGAVREFDFTGLIMPNYKFNVEEEAFTPCLVYVGIIKISSIIYLLEVMKLKVFLLLFVILVTEQVNLIKLRILQ